MNRNSSLKNWDEFWDRKRDITNVYSNVERIIINLKKVVDLNGKKILEVGAGTARDSYALLEEGAQVFVLDYSLTAMDIISSLNNDHKAKVHPILADAFNIPAADESYDIVFHQGLLEHFRNPADILKENIRVLKKGGILLVDVPQKYHIYTIIKHILIFFNKWFAGWETEFTIYQLQNLLEKQGVKVIGKYGNWMRPSLGYRIVRELLMKIKIKLPLYPKGFRLTRQLRNIIRQKFSTKKLAFYTFLDIGVIAKKENNGKP